MDEVMREGDLVSGGPNLIAENIIVGIVVAGGANSSDGVERIPPQGDGPDERPWGLARDRARFAQYAVCPGIPTCP